jgi:hypothetical protein
MIPNKLAGILIGIFSIIFILLITYSAGVHKGRSEKQKIIDEMAAEAVVVEKIVEKQTEKVKKEIVYRDRIVVQKGEELVKKVDDVLKDESKDCRIGNGFIWLHNSSASKN